MTAPLSSSPSRAPAWWPRSLTRGRVILIALVGCCFVAGGAYGSWSRVCAGTRCPSISRLIQSGPSQSAKVYAADGRLIAELGLERRTVLKLTDIPLSVRQAFIATEDKRFYRHHGIDYWRILGALKADILSLGYSQGFSTITMQLARNVFTDQISRDKTLTRKLKEARVAVEIERNFPKDTILELYLNQIDLGSGAHGVDAAAQVYFGKPAKDLNVAEAATLAALPKAPASYNPRLHPDRAVRRRNVVLDLMRDQGLLTPEDAELWKAYPLVLTNNRTAYGDVAPYFVEWIRQTLEAQFGQALYNGGLRIHTTLDLDMQDAAERAVENQLETIESGVYSGNKFPGKTYRDVLENQKASGENPSGFTQYLQGALVSLDVHTGAILAMVGGRDFDDSKYNRVTQALRQAGSTFKPFVYSAAIRAGHPVTEILDDTPLSQPILQKDSQPWNPKDDDDSTWGAIPMRRALYGSRNLATIKLGMSLGEQTVIGEARRYGLTTPIPNVPSIHIGSATVRPLEMASAYTAFATLGTRAAPYGIDYVEDAKGNVLFRSSADRTEVMDSSHTWLMVDMMKDVIRRGTAFSATWGSGFTI
ncbi:MAG TPA: transglycosylase domain-containing protein, partial [Gemmatimonadales bacterium]|nr:transglycosylase domain-containing protein [Gemmatimonadales bacterium]